MSNPLLRSNGAHDQGPQRPHLTILPDDHSHIETSRISLISAKLQELLRHTYFQYYSQIIQELLEAGPQDWGAFVYVRLQSQCSLFRNHHTSIYYNPPPDIFELVAHIRKDKSWTVNRQKVITQVGNARRLSGCSWPDSGGSGLSPYQTTHLAAPTASAQSGPRESQSLFPPGGQYRRMSSGYQSSNRGSSCAAGSPTPTEGYVAAVNAGRTAPKDHRFYCPSKNCSKGYPRQGYTRQGHYENHMQTCHAEWPPHDPAKFLREIPMHPDAGNMDEHVDFGMSAEAPWPTTPHPPLAPSTPCTPLHSFLDSGSERPCTLNAQNVLPEILQFGTQTELSRHVQGSFPPALQPNFGSISQTNWDFPDEGQNLLLPLSQTTSNSTPSFYSSDSYMECQ